MTRTPASLLYRLRSKDDATAWNRFVELFAPLIDRWARQFGFSENDADDIVQDVFACLLRVLPTFAYDPQRSFRAWLTTVTRNSCRDWLKRNRQIATLTEDDFAARSEVPVDEQVAEAEFQAYVIGHAMRIMERDFAPVSWQAFREFVIVGRPAEEVALQFQISRNAVYLCRARVLARLRQELREFLDESLR